MAPASMPAWRTLHFRNAHGSHDFLLFFTFQKDETGLDLQVTDLIHIWRAIKTSKQELKEEALRTRCSIDPTGDQEQYEVLLNKLEEAISGSNRASKVTLLGHSATFIPERFELKTSSPLPTPLGTLEWTFQMVRQEPSALTQELVVPALRVIDASRRREEDLRRKIKDKDHVIGKLMDKIEGSGIDLAMVFPGFAGARKGLNARQAAQVVPGVKAFMVEEWGGDLKDGDDGGFKEILDALKDEGTGKMVWMVLRPAAEGGSGEQPEKERRVDSAKGSKRNHRTFIDEAPLYDIDSSDSSSVGNARPLRRLSSSDSSSALIRSRNTSPKPRPAKLGTLGGTKSKPMPATKQDSSSPSPEPPAKALRKSPSASTATATESDTETDSAPVHRPPKSRTATPKKNPVAKMGIIGGRKPQTNSHEQKPKTKSPDPTTPASQSTPSRAKPKLGAIGGKKSRTASLSSTAALDPTVPSSSLAPRPGRETQQALATDPVGVAQTPAKTEEPMKEAERADQKRAELKRQLDQAGGGKKKRRF